MFRGCQRGRDCQTCAVYGCLTDRHTRLRVLARQRPELATLDLVLLDIQSLREIMTRGDGAWDIVTAKFFYSSSTATVWTFSASSTVCKLIKSTFARTSISTEVFIAGIYTIFPTTLQFFPFSTDRSCRKTVLSIWMMPMCLLTYLWNGGLAHRSYYREVELLMDYYQELHGLLPGDASGLLLLPSVCPTTSLLPHASRLSSYFLNCGNMRC